MPAAHQGKAVGVVEIAAAGAQRHMLAAGVDEPRVQGFGFRRRPHADDAVLGVKDHLALGRHVIRDQRRDADAEIDRPSLGDVAGNARGELVAFERFPSTHLA